MRSSAQSVEGPVRDRIAESGPNLELLLKSDDHFLGKVGALQFADAVEPARREDVDLEDLVADDVEADHE
jgi:hypothetical protein